MSSLAVTGTVTNESGLVSPFTGIINVIVAIAPRTSSTAICTNRVFMFIL